MTDPTFPVVEVILPLQSDRHDIYTRVSTFIDWMERIILENGGLEACGYVIESGFIVENSDGFQDGEDIFSIIS